MNAGKGPSNWIDCIRADRAAAIIGRVKEMGLFPTKIVEIEREKPDRKAAGGKAPEDIQPFLPWNLSPQQRAELSTGTEPATTDSS